MLQVVELHQGEKVPDPLGDRRPVQPVLAPLDPQSKGDILARYEDVGSFAKGTTINHSFPDAESENDQQIAVQRATFTNGTVWNNPTLPEMPAAFSGSSIGAVGSDE